MEYLINYRDLFELEDDIIYLNCSSMSPLLKSVKDAGTKGLEKRSKPWKMTDKDWFGDAEILRSKVADIFQTSNENIVFVPSVSYGLATAAKNLKVKEGKTIILIEDQFPSNYYVWDNLSKQNKLKIIIIKKENQKLLTESIIENINAETGIVAIPNCHWIDGSLIDLLKIRDAVKNVNAYLVLDLSQSLGVLPINIDEIDPDFAVSVGYKWMLGPYSLGYMYISPRMQNSSEPLEYNWSARKGSDDFSSLTLYTTEYREGARKFDMGEFSQFNSIQMAIAAAEQILNWGIDNIQQSLLTLTNEVSKYLNIKKHFEKPVTPNAGHIVAIPINEKDKQLIRVKLSEKKIFVSIRGSSIRVSPHLYNTKTDIENLIQALQ